jgi:glycerol-3-phosphate acyltransferase PlsY
LNLALIVGIASLGYLLGSIPFGLLLTRAAGLPDIRRVGSGNIGATNVLRTGRKGLAIATLLLDGLKGAAAVLLGQWLFGGAPGALIGGLAAVSGHLFPVWLGFRGGKGVATGLGVLIAASPPVGLAAGAVWIVVVVLARMSSAAALAAFAAAPVLAALLDRGLLPLALAVAVLVYLRHRANIARLLAGTEPKIGGQKIGGGP